MKPANARILTINGGSSSIKFALFDAGDSLRRILEGGPSRKFRGILAGNFRPREEKWNPSLACGVRLPPLTSRWRPYVN